ncbi:MAG TPA: (2Fe-2S) ferredoxin domain-containing protein [Candidatus Excrementavichristensenella intestinipullorum]|nr:(2Fe-2S) ferredoxin domain-containing protein [Candidatus Excrementavichristensenella intestinipullorum]
MKITVCIGSSCHLKGSRQVIEGLQKLLAQHGLQDKVEMAGQFCMGDCQNGVCVTLDGAKFSLKPQDVDSFFQREILPKLA